MGVADRPVRENHLLAALPGNRRAAIETCGCRVELDAGAVLLSAQQAIGHVWFVESGVVSVDHRSVDGSAVEIALIGREGLVGAPAALGAESAPQTCRVRIAGSAMRLPTIHFREMLDSDDALRSVVLDYTNGLLMQVSQAVACAARHSITQRLARWIAMCHSRAAQSELEVTHQSLARILGVRRAGVTGALHVLEGEHAIRSVRGRILVRDAGKLHALACCCPTEFPGPRPPRQHRYDFKHWLLPQNLDGPGSGVIRG